MERQLKYILAFQVLDMIIGSTQAFYTSSFTSKAFKQGIFHKLGIWLSICTFYLLERYTGMEIVSYVTKVFTLYEVFSIIENLGELDSCINFLPPEIEKILSRFKQVNYKEKDK